MKVTRAMLREEFRGRYWSLQFTGRLLSYEPAVKLFGKLGAASKGRNSAALQCDETFIPSRSGGPDIRVRIFKPLTAAGPLPAMLYLHGGGYVAGVPEMFLGIIEKFVAARPCIVVAPDYRKALAAPYPAAFDDCYDTLLWLKENAAALGARADKFIVAGHSAGGGLTAALSLKAAATGDVDIAFQMPIYPMIDDRQETESAVDCDAPVWNSRANALGWRLYLKDLKARNAPIPPYAAAARATDYSRLPPTITFVGDLEPFRDETLAYVDNLKKAGIPVVFELFEGCFHGFDQVVPKAEVSQAAWRFVLAAFGEFVAAYFGQDG